VTIREFRGGDMSGVVAIARKLNASARRFYRQLGYSELSLTLEKTLS
jgi:hypothetical protein